MCESLFVSFDHEQTPTLVVLEVKPGLAGVARIEIGARRTPNRTLLADVSVVALVPHEPPRLTLKTRPFQVLVFAPLAPLLAFEAPLPCVVFS